jgi:hypothetical protein
MRSALRLRECCCVGDVILPSGDPAHDEFVCAAVTGLVSGGGGVCLCLC